MRRAVVASLALAASAAAPIPWPGGRAPTATELGAMVREAEERLRQDRALELASAIENEQEALLFGVTDERLHRAFGLPEVFDYGLRAFRVSPRADFGAGGPDGTSAIARVQRGSQGGRDATACEGCHSVGGRDGAGAATQTALTDGDGRHLTSARPRNPPHLLGVGLVEQLAAEMSRDLAATAARAREGARTAPVTLRLVSKGVSFGALTALPSGALDLSAVAGVDDDLVVRPFGWKGRHARLRRMVEDAARTHLGLQAVALEATASAAPGSLGDGPPWDPDDDGVVREIEDGSLTALTVYLQLLEAPAVVPPADAALAARHARGDVLFDAIGCAVCHTRALRLDQRVVTEASDARPTLGVTFNLLGDGDHPKGDDRVALLSDLKRHDLGPGLADTAADPHLPASVWLTRPLWGLADSGPWLHDGRAATIEDAIDAHGGEAAPARDAWRALPAEDRASLSVWLRSLSRAPRVRAAR